MRRLILLLTLLPLFVLKPSLYAQGYTLGPGDSLNIRILDKPETARRSIPVAPDGTISYLQASNVRVAGLTIPAARKAIEAALGKTIRNVRLIVTPGKLTNNTYTILGEVPKRGSFALNGRTTLLQALAASGGISKGATAPGEFKTEADLKRSFVVRGGRRLSVNFEDLYLRGDQRQNITLRAGDYIYVASTLDNQFYVLGAVENPGVQRIVPQLGVVGALTRQQGFAEGAWKRKVLLVRGSTVDPKSYVIDVNRILKGQMPDVPVEVGDIVYVHSKPWQSGGKILGNAFSAFVRAVAITSTDREVNGTNR